jgi:hypothetical protein
MADYGDQLWKPVMDPYYKEECVFVIGGGMALRQDDIPV